MTYLVGSRIKPQVFQTFCSRNETRFQNLALQFLQESADRIGKVRLQEYRAALGENRRRSRFKRLKLSIGHRVVQALKVVLRVEPHEPTLP